MFNMGFSELIALSVIALVVIGPKQLPQVARAIGRFLNELKRATEGVTGSVDKIKKDSSQLFETPILEDPPRLKVRQEFEEFTQKEIRQKEQEKSIVKDQSRNKTEEKS